jgi:hypothetical protein
MNPLVQVGPGTLASTGSCGSGRSEASGTDSPTFSREGSPRNLLTIDLGQDRAISGRVAISVEHRAEISGKFVGDVPWPAGGDEVGQNLGRPHEPAGRLATNGIGDRLGNCESCRGHKRIERLFGERQRGFRR